MRTEFCVWLRKLRGEHEQSQKEMADLLGVSQSFLSLMESGKRNVPLAFCEKVIEAYNLDIHAGNLLKESAYYSRRTINIDLIGKSPLDRTVMITFFNNFNKLSEKDKKNIEYILMGV